MRAERGGARGSPITCLLEEVYLPRKLRGCELGGLELPGHEPLLPVRQHSLVLMPSRAPRQQQGSVSQGSITKQRPQGGDGVWLGAAAGKSE